MNNIKCTHMYIHINTSKYDLSYGSYIVSFITLFFSVFGDVIKNLRNLNNNPLKDVLYWIYASSPIASLGSRYVGRGLPQIDSLIST